VSAAMPHEHHEACCNKHHTLRLQAEAESRPYSRFDSSQVEDMACADNDVILQVRWAEVMRFDCCSMWGSIPQLIVSMLPMSF
jgi:hypothetical protein